MYVYKNKVSTYVLMYFSNEIKQVILKRDDKEDERNENTVTRNVTYMSKQCMNLYFYLTSSSKNGKK